MAWDGDRTNIFAYLAGLDEPDLRNILRSHKESAFTSEEQDDKDNMDVRSALDVKLEEIMLDELEVQAGIESVNKAAENFFFKKLIQCSPAFTQYLNVYLYFGVRFAVGRVPLKALDPPGDNQPVVGLPAPPPLRTDKQLNHEDVKKFGTEFGKDKFKCEYDEKSNKQWETYRHEKGKGTPTLENQALLFLDGFTSDREKLVKSEVERETQRPSRTQAFGDEHTKFELWLRGLTFLHAGHTEEGFQTIAEGLLDWANRRYKFYTALESADAKEGKGAWVAKWKKQRWTEGFWNVNNPLVACCAIVDFYWLARILRAEVSPRGLVTYPKRSWLYYLATRRPSRNDPDFKFLRQRLRIEGDQNELFASAILRREEVLRSVFGYACDLVQNAVEIAEEDEVKAATRGSDDLKARSPKSPVELPPSTATNKRGGVLIEPATVVVKAEAPQLTTGEPPPPKKAMGGSGSKETLSLCKMFGSADAWASEQFEKLAERCRGLFGTQAQASCAETGKVLHGWRPVYDEELHEIRRQRRRFRRDDGPSAADEWDGKSGDGEKETESATERWSLRIRTGEDVDNLTGIALSGGGIRSATFCLGVLQRLQELDLLRHADYLSTVSGGGYIGAWLIGNVRRTRYWLSRLTSWDKSIEHLRRYSNYLAPENGLLSPDTWTMWGTWIRNAFLIQLTVFTWLASMLVGTFVFESVFVWAGEGSNPTSSRSLAAWIGRLLPLCALILLLAVITLIVVVGLWSLSDRANKPDGRAMPPYDGVLPRIDALGRRFCILKLSSELGWLPAAAAVLVWVEAFLTAGLLWGQAVRWRNAAGLLDISSYEAILRNAWRDWPPWAGIAFIVSLVFVVVSCQEFAGRKKKVRSWFSTFFIVAAGLACTYLAFCGLLRLYGEFLSGDFYVARGVWYAYVFGPSLAISGLTLTIFILIGLIGKDSPAPMREWWTRFGALVAMLGAGTLLLALVAVFAPRGVYKVATLKDWGKTVSVSAILGWLGSVTSGLLAGNSSKTGKGNGQTSPVLEWVAWIGGLLFIAGALVLAATTVYFVLGNALNGPFLPGDYWNELSRFRPFTLYWISLGLLLLGLLFSWRFDLNTFSLNQFYRNRLVRCYLGATWWQPGKRHPDLFIGFDDADDIELTKLRFSEPNHPNPVPGSSEDDDRFRGPLPLVNCTLNLGGSSDLTVHTRQSASFTLTPLRCGALRDKVGFMPTERFAAGAFTLGQAISVSGAAASPNMGYSTSPLVSVLMTLFNVRLGWWFPNPGKPMKGKSSSLSAFYLVRELFGVAGEDQGFINVSDGGHFENLGIYELVRRRARVIIAVDAECDPQLTFGSLGNLARICETDFGAAIEIDVDSLRKRADSGESGSHCAIGKITYSNGTFGYLIYMKASITGDEDVGVAQYRSGHPSFPHETTADQFFREDQFEAYRRLGHHAAERTFRDIEGGASDLFALATKLFDLWVPAGFSNEAFLTHAKAFDQLWDRFRGDRNLDALLQELTDGALNPPASVPPLSDPEKLLARDAAELCACMELLQLMENVFLDLRLDDFWEHPDNRGWAMFFTMCAKSPKFQLAWTKVRQTYGIRFEYFCCQHLGLEIEHPVMRA